MFRGEGGRQEAARSGWLRGPAARHPGAVSDRGADTDGTSADRPDGRDAAGGDEDGARDPVDGLVALLELDDIGDDRFGEGNHDRGFGPRVFCGQVAAQALRAAQLTVPADGPDPHRTHSIHASFLLAGQPGAPIVYEVDRLRDGRSFTTRRVEAHQG